MSFNFPRQLTTYFSDFLYVHCPHHLSPSLIPLLSFIHPITIHCLINSNLRMHARTRTRTHIRHAPHKSPRPLPPHTHTVTKVPKYHRTYRSVHLLAQKMLGSPCGKVSKYRAVQFCATCPRMWFPWWLIASNNNLSTNVVSLVAHA